MTAAHGLRGDAQMAARRARGCLPVRARTQIGREQAKRDLAANSNLVEFRV